MGSFTDGMLHVTLVEVDFPGLGKVEVFGPGVTIVDDEFYFTSDPIATPLVLSAVIDVFTSYVQQDDCPLEDHFQFRHVVNTPVFSARKSLVSEDSPRSVSQPSVPRS